MFKAIDTVSRNLDVSLFVDSTIECHKISPKDLFISLIILYSDSIFKSLIAHNIGSKAGFIPPTLKPSQCLARSVEGIVIFKFSGSLPPKPIS